MAIMETFGDVEDDNQHGKAAESPLFKNDYSMLGRVGSIQQMQEMTRAIASSTEASPGIKSPPKNTLLHQYGYEASYR